MVFRKREAVTASLTAGHLRLMQETFQPPPARASVDRPAAFRAAGVVVRSLNGKAVGFALIGPPMRGRARHFGCCVRQDFLVPHRFIAMGRSFMHASCGVPIQQAQAATLGALTQLITEAASQNVKHSSAVEDRVGLARPALLTAVGHWLRRLRHMPVDGSRSASCNLVLTT